MSTSSKYLLAILALFLITIPIAYSGCIHDDLDIQLEELPHEDVDPETAGTHDDERILATSWGGLRIHVDYSDISGASSTIKNYIQNRLIPPAINYFEDTLQVSRLSNLKLSDSSMCGIRVPSKYKTGVKADLILFVSGGSSSDSFLAWAKPCKLLSTSKRPIVGQIYFNFKGLVPSNDLEFQTDLLTTMHEMTHVLGFSSSLYNSFPTKPSIKSKTVNGKKVNYINVDPLTKRLRTHFGCNSIPGAYLENQGGSGSAGSHFERRVFMNEYMTASSIPDTRISQFTLAMLEGSGWYKPKYENADHFVWGKGDGCDFVDGSCSASKFSEFCSGSSTGCTYHGTGGGYCGNSDNFADGCRYMRPYANENCEDTGNENSQTLAAEEFGFGSKCFMGTLYQGSAMRGSQSYCFKYECDKQSNGDYVLNVKIGKATGVCKSKGNIKVSGYSGTLACPDPDAYCTGVGKKVCKRGCMGKGKCESGKCDCDAGWGGIDCSKKLKTAKLEGDEDEDAPVIASDDILPEDEN